VPAFFLWGLGSLLLPVFGYAYWCTFLAPSRPSPAAWIITRHDPDMFFSVTFVSAMWVYCSLRSFLLAQGSPSMMRTMRCGIGAYLSRRPFVQATHCARSKHEMRRDIIDQHILSWLCRALIRRPSFGINVAYACRHCVFLHKGLSSPCTWPWCARVAAC